MTDNSPRETPVLFSSFKLPKTLPFTALLLFDLIMTFSLHFVE